MGVSIGGSFGMWVLRNPVLQQIIQKITIFPIRIKKLVIGPGQKVLT